MPQLPTSECNPTLIGLCIHTIGFYHGDQEQMQTLRTGRICSNRPIWNMVSGWKLYMKLYRDNMEREFTGNLTEVISLTIKNVIFIP